MALTADLLVKIPECGSQILAGHGGKDRPISWAHGCEEGRPWQWLGDKNLVMTTGIAIPANANEQRRYVEKCAAQGIVGVAIGEKMNAPELSDEFFEAANELNFVVLLTAREVPFIVLSRAFAEYEQEAERERLLRSKRVYEAVLRTTLSPSAGSDRLEIVGEAIGHEVEIINLATNAAIMPRTAATETAASIPVPLTLELPVPDFPHAIVRMTPYAQDSAPLEQGIQQHVSLIAALELERENTEREKAYRHATAWLNSLLEGRDITSFEHPGASVLDLDSRNYYLATGSRVHNGVELFHTLLDAGFHCAIYPHSEFTYAFLPADMRVLKLVQCWVSNLGVSEKTDSISDARTALGQSQLAHQSALERDVPLLHFSERTASIVPDSATAADLLIEQTLGNLLTHDAKRGTEYVRSLRVFLQENRSWNSASESLYIHKQTLVYRMRRVTEMTGLRLDTTQDVAVFWVALEALETYR